jgi:hypothetical protein
VGEAAEADKRLLENVMGGFGFRGGDEADAAGVVVVERVKQVTRLRGCGAGGLIPGVPGDTAALSAGKWLK